MTDLDYRGIKAGCFVFATCVVCASLWMVATEAASAMRAWGEAPAQVTASINALPAAILPPVTRSVDAAVGLADLRVKDATTRLDSRVGEALAEVKATRVETLATVNATMRTLDARAAAIQSDARPALVNAAALTKDAQDSWDDLYPDMKSTVESATVAVTSVAQASEEIRAAAPALAASAVQVGKSAESTSASVAGVALDVKREVDEATRPKKWWQKALGPVYTIGRIAGAFL